MTAISRIVSGTIASWTRIGVNLGTQVLLVPIFLSRWDASTYGLWIGIFALAGLIQFVDSGHNSYIGFEALKLGAQARAEISRLYRSALQIAIYINAIELAVVLVCCAVGWHLKLLGAQINDAELSAAVGVVLILQSTAWLVYGNRMTAAGRVLNVFGYYPILAWYHVTGAVITGVAPAVAVLFGANLLYAGIVYSVAHAAYAAATLWYMHRAIKREGIDIVSGTLAIGLKSFSRSLALSLRNVLEMLRQEQFRVVLAPLVGATTLVLFVTTRTLSNIVVAGLATITGPLMPEFMRYLHQRDVGRSTAAMTVVWITVVGLLAPLAVVGQTFVEPLFVLWTRGQIPFDPVLLALLSMNVLVFGFSQPALSIVQGFNILNTQLAISLIGAAVALLGTVALAPAVGVRGAAASLLASEICIAALSVKSMRQQFETLEMRWPRAQVSIAALATGISAILILLSALRVAGTAFVLTSGFLCAALSSILLVKALPPQLHALALNALKRGVI